MVATVASELNIPFNEARSYRGRALEVLYNEAMRQRAEKALFFGITMSGTKDQLRYLQRMLEAHNSYVVTNNIVQADEVQSIQALEALRNQFKGA